MKYLVQQTIIAATFVKYLVKSDDNDFSCFATSSFRTLIVQSEHSVIRHQKFQSRNIYSSIYLLTSFSQFSLIMSQIDAFYRKFYLREIDLFYLDFSIIHIYLVENILVNSDRTWFVHRDVKFFVKKIERIKRKYQIDVFAIAQHCLRDFANAWFKNLFELIQQNLTQNFEWFCVRLNELFDSMKQTRQKKEEKQRIEKNRIAKKQKKIRLTIFACKRCSVKFSNNTKLHQHIQNHHQKKKIASESAKFISNEFATFSSNEFAKSSSNSKSSSKTMLVEFTSSEFVYHASIASSILNELAKFSFSFKFFAERCAFYINYSSAQYFSSSQLFSANFICKQNSNMSDQVYCEICDFQFYDFENDENSYQKHIEYSSTCFWILAKRTSKTFTSKAVFTSSATSSLQNESKLMFTSSTNFVKTISKFSSFIISSATSRNQLFWIEIVSRSINASKFSRLSIATSRIVSKMTKIASMICSSISSSILSRNSISKHQEQKFYLTIHDLFRMFAEKFKKTNLLHIRYFIKKSKSSSKLFNQIKIIAYYKSAVNQNKSIIQNSKNSNSKNFRQRMLAETIRIILNKWFEKSINLSYKSSIFFRLHTSEISIVSSYKMSTIFRLTFLIEFSKFLIKINHFQIYSISIIFQICRICSDTFKSNMNLQSAQKQSLSLKRLVEIMRIFARMIERSNAISWLENSWSVDEKTDRFFTSFHVLLIDFSKNDCMFSSRDTTKTL